MIRKKVCMLGAYAVGKTSLVRRFVTDTFSDRYETTIGVKITKKQMIVGEVELTLLLWDLHGDDEFQTIKETYLRGASGLFFVVDGTRPETVDKARELHERTQHSLGELPTLVLANKSDLNETWELDASLSRHFSKDLLRPTSAKTGDGVEEAFRELCERMLEPS